MLTIVVGERVWKRDVGGSVKAWLRAQGMTGVNTRRQPVEFESEAFKGWTGTGVAMDSDGHLLAYGYQPIYNETFTAPDFFCIALADVNEEAVWQDLYHGDWIIAEWNARKMIYKNKQYDDMRRVNDQIWLAVKRLIEEAYIEIERVLGCVRDSNWRLVRQFGLGHCAALAISPDSKSLFCACTDRATRELCTETGDVLHIYNHNGHSLKRVKSEEKYSPIAVSKDGSWIGIEVKAHGWFIEWNLNTGLERYDHFARYPQEGDVRIEYNENEGGLTEETRDKTLSLRKCKNGFEVWSQMKNKCLHTIRHVDLSRRTQFGKKLIKKNEGEVDYAGFTPDGKKVITRNKEGSDVRIWDVQSGKMLSRVSFGSYAGAAFSPGGKLIIARNMDSGHYELFSATTGELLRILEVNLSSSSDREPCMDNTFSFSFSEDSTRVLTQEKKYARLWDTVSGKCLRSFRCSKAFLSPDGNRVLTSCDNESRLRNAITGRALTIVKSKYARMSPNWSTIQFLSDFRYVIEVTQKNEILFSTRDWKANVQLGRLWLDLHDGYIPKDTLERLSGGDQSFFYKYVDCCIFSPDFTKIAILVDYDGDEYSIESVVKDFRRRDIFYRGTEREFDGLCKYEFWVGYNPLHSKPMLVEFSADSNKAVVSMYHCTHETFVIIFSQNKIVRFKAERVYYFGEEEAFIISAVAISPSGNFAATGSVNQKVVLWDANTGEYLQTLWDGEPLRKAPFEWENYVSITGLSFLSDETRLLAKCNDGTFYLWYLDAPQKASGGWEDFYDEGNY